MNRLENKVALVFGGSPNIAGTCAHWFAKAGAKVAICSRSEASAKGAADYLADKGFDVLPVIGDPTTEADAERIVTTVIEHYGRIDVMLNQVGDQHRDTVMDYDLDGWNQQIQGYMTGGMLTTKYTARSMVKNGNSGSIIHVLSDAAHQGEAGNSGYSAAKAGLLNYCRAAAMELAEYKIRVNTVSPTFMDHLLWQYPVAAFNSPESGPHGITGDDFLQGIPLRRFCSARDVADAALFLASDDAAYITAVDIPLDGGARAKYWPWQPGKHSGVTIDKLLEDLQPHRFGDTADDIEFQR